VTEVFTCELSFLNHFFDLVDLLKVLYLLTLGPVEIVLRILQNIFELIIATLYWAVVKIGIVKKDQDNDSQHTPTSSARFRAFLAKKKKTKTRIRFFICKSIRQLN
jgi:hypothetical protein